MKVGATVNGCFGQKVTLRVEMLQVRVHVDRENNNNFFFFFFFLKIGKRKYCLMEREKKKKRKANKQANTKITSKLSTQANSHLQGKFTLLSHVCVLPLLCLSTLSLMVTCQTSALILFLFSAFFSLLKRKPSL